MWNPNSLTQDLCCWVHFLQTYPRSVNVTTNKICMTFNKQMEAIFVIVLQYHHHHHHHVMPLARISLTLSRHFSLSFIASGRSSELHPVSSHSCCMYVRAGRPAFAQPYVGVHHLWACTCFSSSVLHVWFV